MQVTPKDLEKLWATVSREPPSPGHCRARRVETDGSVAVYAGVRNSDGALAILFEMEPLHAPDRRFRFQTEGISLVREASVGSAPEILSLVAIDPSVNPLFGVLCSDIIGHVLRGQASSAGARLQSRLGEWREALKVRREILSREAVLGLWGELHLLRQIAAAAGPQTAVAAWAGPEDGLHDFAGNGIAIECKTQSGADAAIQISGLDQLQRPAGARLVLVRVRVAESLDGVSLTQTIADSRALAGGWELERKLALAGWRDQDAELHRSPLFALVDQTAFEITDEFPALTRNNTPPGVVDARYRIDSRMAQPFAIGPDEFTRLLTVFGGKNGSGA